MTVHHTAATTTTTANSSLLRTSIRLDAIISMVAGVLTMIAAWPLAELMGVSAPLAVLGVGLFFDLYGATLMYISRSPERVARFARWIIVGNVIWALDTLALATFGVITLSTAGFWIVAAQALVVLDIAFFQLYALRRS